MTAKITAKQKWDFPKKYAYILVVGSIIGLLMSFVITVEKVMLLQDPSYVPGCSINPVISCGNIMASDQASVFGFPNPLIGLIGFPVVLTIGMGMLAGARFKAWFWRGLQAGTIFGVLFCMWLFYQAVYVIGSLCPYCIVVWVVTIPIFLYTTIWNIKNGFIQLGSKTKQIAAFVTKHHGDILFVWYLAIFLAILMRFWYYWKTLI